MNELLKINYEAEQPTVSTGSRDEILEVCGKSEDARLHSSRNIGGILICLS